MVNCNVLTNEGPFTKIMQGHKLMEDNILVWPYPRKNNFLDVISILSPLSHNLHVQSLEEKHQMPH